MLKQILLVGLGGGTGSILRFLASLLAAKTSNSFSFPVTTFVVNILGCLLIGLLVGISLKNNWLDVNMKLLLITGFCGGFTTFSTFSLENFQLYQAGNYVSLIAYTLASVLVGFAAVWIGLLCTDMGQQ
jgi:CrcB protein